MRRAIASLWRPVSGSARLAVARSLISAGLILAAVGGDVRAAVQDPVAQAPLAKGVAFLKQHAAEVRSPSHRILVAYALLKAEEPTSSPLIQEAATNISSRVQDGKFAPTGGQESIYSAGVEMMFLADLNANRYIDELHAASQYILEQQNSDGSWSYAKGGMGDTSITQYAILGLWSASRSGIDVPLDAWNRAAQWLIQTQMPDGGFAYTPGTNNGPEGGKSSPTMTPAAVGSLLVIRLHLYPEVKEFGARARQESGAREDKKLFGVLEAAESPEARPVSASEARSALGNAVPLAQLDGAIRRGLGWIAA